MAPPKITHKMSYIALCTDTNEFSVFAVDGNQPDWWRRVARFADQARADDYAEMENSMIFEFCGDEEDGKRFDDVKAAPPATPSPASNLTPRLLLRREHVTHHQTTQIERQEVFEEQQPASITVAEATAPIPVPTPAPPQIEEGEEAEIETVDCATLLPLTSLQMQVFKVFVEARGVYVSGQDLNKRVGSSGQGTIPGVVKKGYLRRRETVDGACYDVIVHGAPRVEAAVTSKITHPATIVPAEQRTVTQEFFGDPKRPAPDALDVRGYLIRKGHTAFLGAAGWVIDGAKRRDDEVLDLVNSHRHKAELEPLAALP